MCFKMSFSCCTRRRSGSNHLEVLDSDSSDEELETGGLLPAYERLQRRILDFNNTSYRNRILQTLKDLPEAVTNDFEMAALDSLCMDAEEDERKHWVPIMLDIVPTVPLHHPLASALIGVVVDSMPNPTQQTLTHAARELHAVAQSVSRRILSAEVIKKQRNLLTLLECLAERFAGPHSSLLLSDAMVQCLLVFLQSKSPRIQLHALLAVEKFGMTGANKDLLMKSGVSHILHEIEEQTSTRLAERSSSWFRNSISEARIIAQLGFCSMWALDNVFPCEGRQYTIDRTDTSRVNVMLDVKDATKHLKLAPNGLEARNDSQSFESVRATCCAKGKGLWYYEVTLLTGGIMQIGWATDRCTYKSEEGVGIGDDRHSWAYDGQRSLLWHNQGHKRHQHRKWREDDVLGLLLDLDRGRISFSLNGQFLNLAYTLVFADLENIPFFPAASLMTMQHVQFNFGTSQYRFPPNLPFRSLNEMGHMTSDEKRIVPRLVLLDQLREERQHMDESEVCLICYDQPPSVELRPCRHMSFCEECAELVSSCPLCRVEITERIVCSEVPAVRTMTS